MGYFKRPLRRSEAQADRLAFLEPARELPPHAWRRCGPAVRPAADSFLRFVVEQPGDGAVGLFRCCELLESAEDLPASARSQARAAFRWFTKHLPVPRRLPRNAVCWFRAGAAESLGRIRVLIEVYRMVGRPVWMQATRTPGRVVYQDEYQVAAVAYRDRRRTSSLA